MSNWVEDYLNSEAYREEQQREQYEIECYRRECEEQAYQEQQREAEHEAYCECCWIAEGWLKGELSEEDAEQTIAYTHYGWTLEQAADHITTPEDRTP